MSTIRKLDPAERALLFDLRRALADRRAHVATATLAHIVQDLSDHYTFTLREAPMPDESTDIVIKEEVVYVNDGIEHRVRTRFGPPDVTGHRAVQEREWLW